MLSKRRLLLADDSIAIQKVVELTFDGEDLQVTSVGDGDEAIRQLEESPPDILLADVFMPGRNGYEVCEHVKRSERLRSIPVMLLVGTFEPFDEAEARRVGADDVLTKPFQSIRELVGKVGSLLGSRPAEQTTVDEEKMKPQAQSQVAETRNQQGDSAVREAFDGEEGASSIGSDRAQAGAFGEQAAADDQMIEVSTADEFNRHTRTTTPDTFTTAGTGFPQHRQRQHEPSSENEPPTLTTGALQSEGKTYPRDAQHQPFADLRPAESAGGMSARPAAFGSRITHAEQADEALLDLGNVETPRHAAEADDFILDLTDDAPDLSARQHHSATDDGAVEMPAPFMPETASEVTTELPPLQDVDFNQEAMQSNDMRSYSTQELEEQERFGGEVFRPAVSAGLGESVASSPPQLESAVAEPEVMGEVMDSSSAQSLRHAGAVGTDQLSPEVIDMIARRAVEHLSDAVVREIAWEVVPQLAELIIRRRLEEENSSKT